MVFTVSLRGNRYRKPKNQPIFALTLFVLLGLGLPGIPSFGFEEVPISEIYLNRDRYDGKEVSVSGEVVNVKRKTSKAGKDYTTFSLRGAGGESIHVFIWGHQSLKEGQKVKVIGTYRKTKRVGRYTFQNEIEAKEIIK